MPAYLFMFYNQMNMAATSSMMNLVVASPVLFISLRIFIGFLIGGIWPTAGTLAIENIFQNHKYYYRKSGYIVKKEQRAEYLSKKLEKFNIKDTTTLKYLEQIDEELDNLFYGILESGSSYTQKRVNIAKLRSVWDSLHLNEKYRNTEDEFRNFENSYKGFEKSIEKDPINNNAVTSDLIIYIKAVEKIIYIEKLRMIEKLVLQEIRTFNQIHGGDFTYEDLLHIQKLRKYDRMEKVTWQSGVTQTGFSLGILAVSIIAFSFTHGVINLSLLDFMKYLHLGLGVSGAIWSVVLIIYLRESLILKYELGKRDNLRNFIGLRELLKNNKTRDTLFNFWLIMTGLLYLYYSTIITAPDILKRDNIINWTFFNSPDMMSLGIQFAIVSVVAHLTIPILCQRLWRERKAFDFLSSRNSFYKLYNWFLQIFVRITEGPGVNSYSIISENHTMSHREPSKDGSVAPNPRSEEQDISDMDVRLMIALGVTLAILSGTVFILFRLLLPPNGISNNPDGVILLTMVVIFVGNSGFGLIPSMIASGFPVHLRNIGSSLGYNGGLVIGFASPFISMEFFLYTKNDYLLAFPLLLGALSIIIGSKRLLKNSDDKKERIKNESNHQDKMNLPSH